jgi:hypothetical protein
MGGQRGRREGSAGTAAEANKNHDGKMEATWLIRAQQSLLYAADAELCQSGMFFLVQGLVDEVSLERNAYIIKHMMDGVILASGSVLAMTATERRAFAGVYCIIL